MSTIANVSGNPKTQDAKADADTETLAASLSEMMDSIYKTAFASRMEAQKVGSGESGRIK